MQSLFSEFNTLFQFKGGVMFDTDKNDVFAAYFVPLYNGAMFPAPEYPLIALVV